MNKTKMKRVGVLLLVIILIFYAVILSGCKQQTEMVYNVYFGLNDADTGEQEVTMDEASAYIRSVIESYGYGYTEYRTYGAYTENGISKGNDTLVYMLIFVDKENIKKISDEVIEHLNLASVLCQQQEMQYEFFIGQEKQGS
jgi:lipoprotein